MGFTDGIDVAVGDAILASHTDNLADNTEFNRSWADVDHNFDISTATGKHKDIQFGADSTFDIGTTAVRAANLFVDNIGDVGQTLNFTGGVLFNGDVRIDTNLGVHCDPAGKALIEITDAAVETTTDVYGVEVALTKTAGVTNVYDDLYGGRFVVDLDQNGSNMGYIGGVYAKATITDGTIGSVIAETDLMALFGQSENYGDIDGDLYGLRIWAKNLVAGTVTGDMFGIYVAPQDDVAVAGTVYGIYLDEIAGIDYGIYQNGSAANRLGGALTIVGLVTASGGILAGGDIDLDGNSLILDQDGDSKLTSPADDAIGVELAGAEVGRWTTTGLSLAATKKLYLDGGGDTYISESSADNVGLYVGAGGLNVLYQSGFMNIYGLCYHIAATYMEGNALYLDADRDTYISAAVDDQIQYYLGGVNAFSMTGGGGASPNISVKITSGDGGIVFHEEGVATRYQQYYSTTNNWFAVYSYTSAADIFRIPDSQLTIDANSTWDADVFDYVCANCGWHGPDLVTTCPECGSLKVAWHDDVALMDQMLHTDLRHDQQAVRRMEQLGVVNTYGTLGQSNPELFTSLNRMPWFIMSGLVQEHQSRISAEEEIHDEIDTLKSRITELEAQLN
jgi:hypothetical protein